MALSLIDSHFHSEYLNDSDISDQIGIDVGICADDLPNRFNRLKNFKGIVLSAAMGPWECGKSTTKEESDVSKYSFRTDWEINQDFETLRYNIDKYKPLFIGECGLDYYWEYGTRKQQLSLFEKHMNLAETLNKAVIIHNREADQDTIEMICKHKVKTGIIHCFSGDKTLMKCALDNGYYISFAGNLTYKKNTDLRDRLKEVPSDRLLLETDSPYLTPVPLRGQPNSPDKILYTYQCASEVLKITLEQLDQQIRENFQKLISL